jgi:hypothetical protein
MKSRIALWLVLLAGLAAARAQQPDPKEGLQLWQGHFGGKSYRVLQIPKQATALIPLRFLVEEVEAPTNAHAATGPVCPHCNPGATNLASVVLPKPTAPAEVVALDAAEFKAVGGIEATRSYLPRRDHLQYWRETLGEVRETFRAPGAYQLTLYAGDQPERQVVIRFDVKAYEYIGFGEEFGLFVAGCIGLGLFLLAVVKWLHHRGFRSQAA